MQVEPGEGEDERGLENDEEEREEDVGAEHGVVALGPRVDAVEGQTFQDEVDEGPDAEHDGAEADGETAMALCMN